MEKYKSFLTFKNIFISILIIAVLVLFTFNGKTKIERIKVPEIVIKSDTIFLEKIVEVVNVKYKDGTAVVNKNIFESYEKEKDTLKKKEIFIEAVQVRKNKTTVLDNDKAKVTVNSTVEGKLVSLQADVVLKEREVEVKVNEPPRLSLVLGTDMNYNNLKFNPGLNAGIQTRNGNIYKVGVNLDKSVTIGFSKTFTLIK